MQPRPVPEKGPLHQAELEIREDHHKLGRLLESMAAAKSLAEITATMAELQPALASHFTLEERPGGLYDALHATVPEQNPALAELVHDHRQIAKKVDQLRQRSLQFEGHMNDLSREISELVQHLRAHEKREHDLAYSALQVYPT